MENILITGGAGFIGSTLTNHLSKQSYKITVIDDLSMGKKENLHVSSNINLVEGSVTDRELMKNILSNTNFDYVFHLAAVASVADSIERPVETHEINFESVLLLLELCKKYQSNMQRLIFSSSAAVYGDEPTLPKKENSMIKPLTPYAIDKFSAEQYVLSYAQLYNLPTSAVRFFNVYGPNQNPSSPYSGVISILVNEYKKLLNGEQAVFKVFGDGNQSRDFVYVDDAVQALLLVAEKKEAIGQQFNVGTGEITTLNSLFKIIDLALQVHLPIRYTTERRGDIKHSLSDITKIMEIGFSPKLNIVQGMEKYLGSIK